MPEVKPLFGFTSGQNDVVEPDLVGDEQVTDSQNYEMLGPGALTVRKEPEAYSDSLNTYIAVDTGLNLISVLSISPPFYPSNKPSNMTGDFMMVIYGIEGVSGDYEMFLVYEISGDWTHETTGAVNLIQGLTDAGVDWELACKPVYSIGNDRMVITDGVNRAYYITVDADGDVQSSILGIPSPTNKPYIVPQVGYEAGNYSSDADNHVSAPGLVQVSYTAVTDDGQESNPSPLSDTIDFQWFNYDSDNAFDTWIAKISISNLTVPEVAQDILDNLKYFKIYMRVINFSGGTVPYNLQLVQQFEIIDKSVTSATVGSPSGNAYAITLDPAAGEVVSYENDIAPVAAINAQNGGVIMVGGTKSQSMIGYPWVFGYFMEIKLNNQNIETFIDAVITLKIEDEDAGGITGLDWDYYLSVPGATKAFDQNANALRMYDTDGITPLQVAYNTNAFIGDFIICHVRVPQLAPGIHSIYLCWSNTPIPASGVANAHYQTDYDGQWMDVTSKQSAVSALLFTGGEKVRRSETYVCSQCENFLVGDETPNKADVANPATEDQIGHQATPLGYVPFIDFMVGTPPLWFLDAKSLTTDGVVASQDQSYLNYDVTRFGTAPKKGVMVMRWSYTPNTTGIATGTQRNLGGFWTAGLDPLIVLGMSPDGGAPNSYIFEVLIFNTPTTYSNPFSIGSGDAGALDPINSVTKRELAIVFSWDSDNEKASLFIYRADQPATPFVYEEISLTKKIDTTEVLDSYRIGWDTANNWAVTGQEIDQLNVWGGQYISGINAANASAAWNLVNFLPPFSVGGPLGYYFGTDAHNVNVKYETPKTYELKDEDNKFRWGDVNGVNFPDLYSKRLREPLSTMIPAPSFLQFQYENTMVIHTRNTINRFVMTGDPSTWAGDPSRIVQEEENYGMYAADSLTPAGDRLIWLSEDGIILWDPNGIQKISQNVIKVELQTDTQMAGWFQAIRDQYMLHDKTDVVTYVYHFRYGTFYKFSGFPLGGGIPRVLSGGSAVKNINLLIAESVGLGTEIMSSPNRTMTGGPIDWDDVDLDFYSEAGTLSLRAVNAGERCQLPVASAPMLAGFVYTLELDYTAVAGSGWRIQDFTGVQEFGRISATGSGQTLEFTVEAGITGGFRIASLGAGSSEGSFDNFSLKPNADGIYKYPGLNDTTATAYIVTKYFNHLRAVFNRWRFYFTGGNVTVETHVIDNVLDPTELMPNLVDRDFSDSSNWKNNDLGSYDETGDLTITSTAADQYCKLGNSEAPMTPGVKYTMQFDYSALVAGFWIIQDISGVQEFGRVQSTGTEQLITFAVDEGISGGYRIVAGDDTVSGSFDNFSLKTRDRHESKTPLSGVWRWLTNGFNVGEKIYFKITGARTILSGMYEYIIRGAR